MADDVTNAQEDAAKIVDQPLSYEGGGNPYDMAAVGTELTPDQEEGNRAYEAILQEPIFTKDEETGVEKFDPQKAQELIDNLKAQDINEVKGGNSLLTETRRKNLQDNPLGGRNMGVLAQKYDKAQDSPTYQKHLESKYEAPNSQSNEFVKAMNWVGNQVARGEAEVR